MLWISAAVKFHVVLHLWDIYRRDTLDGCQQDHRGEPVELDKGDAGEYWRRRRETPAIAVRMGIAGEVYRWRTNYMKWFRIACDESGNGDK